MLQKTRGIVIHYLKYKDTSIIVKLYTKEYGLISVIVNSIRSSKSKRSIGFFQPLSILDLVIYHKPDRDIQRLSEYRFAYHTPEISNNIYKTTVALFLSEVLGKVLIGDENQQEYLYEFLEHAVLDLNQKEIEIEDFHIGVLLKLSAFLGFELEDTTQLLSSMDIEPLAHQSQVMSYLSYIFNEDKPDETRYSGTIRSESLKLILTYYRHHGIHIGEIKSLKVLQQVFK